MSKFFRHIILLLCLTAPITLLAQFPVTITGMAPFAAGKEIRLLVYEDLLNGIPTVATTDIIDKHGRFSLKYTTHDILLAQLAICTSKAEFFIVPANDYYFNISMDSVLYNRLNPEKYGGFLHIESKKKDTADLNFKINLFSEYFNRIADTYSYPMIYRPSTEIFDSVRSEISQHFEFQYNPTNFYQSYGYYTLGEIDLLQYRKKPVYIYDKYFDNDYILYNNPAYMSLFNQFYDGYLYYSPYISKNLLSRTINETPDYPTLFNEAGRDPKLTNARLRELVIIKNLIAFLDNKEFDAGNIRKLLEYIRATTSFEKHIKLIDNKLNQIDASIRIPEEVTFTDEKGHKAKLKQYQGRPVYLHIFQTDCIDCVREMVIIKELHNKYNEEVQFISLCIDPEKANYQTFVKQYGKMFDWPILYFNEQYDWLISQGVETLPDQMLFKADGTMQMRYAPAPEQELPRYLQLNFPEKTEEDQNPLFYNRNKQ